MVTKIGGTKRSLENQEQRTRVRTQTPVRSVSAPEASAPTTPTAPTTSAPEGPRRVDARVQRDSRLALRSDVATAQLRHRLEADAPPVASSNPDRRFTEDVDGFRVTRGIQSEDEGLASPETREVLRDPADVNVNTTEPQTMGGMMGGSMAAAMVDAMRGGMWGQMGQTMTADERYDALSDNAQADFDRVATTIAEDDDAVRALDRMLVIGRLDGAEGEAVLDELAGLSRDDLANGLEQDALVADLVQEIADPSAINQQGYGTCVPTTASIHLAENNPAEYVRLVRGLAQEDGRVELANGDEISRHSDTIDEPEDYMGPERSQSSRLLVPALMEYGNGSLDYDADDDTHQRDYGLFKREDGRGLNNGGMDRIMEGITGETYDSFVLNGDDDGSVTDELGRRTEGGEQIPVSLAWSGNWGHEVLVTRVADDHVYYTNPWGQEERMDRSEFESRLTGVNQVAA